MVGCDRGSEHGQEITASQATCRTERHLSRPGTPEARHSPRWPLRTVPNASPSRTSAGPDRCKGPDCARPGHIPELGPASPHSTRVGVVIRSFRLGRKRSARYQLSMPVSAPGRSQACRYSAISSAVKASVRLDLMSARASRAERPAPRKASGSKGSWKKAA